MAHSVDKALYIAKTTSTVTVALLYGTTATRIMLTTDEHRLLRPLIPTNF